MGEQRFLEISIAFIALHKIVLTDVLLEWRGPFPLGWGWGGSWPVKWLTRWTFLTCTNGGAFHFGKMFACLFFNNVGRANTLDWDTLFLKGLHTFARPMVLPYDYFAY